MKLIRLVLALQLLLVLATTGWGQSFYRLSPPAPGGVLRLCAVTDGNPCNPTQPMFSDQALTQPIIQPVQLGSDGNFGFWTQPGQYVLQISSPFNRLEFLNLAGPLVGSGGVQLSLVAAPSAVNFGTVTQNTPAAGGPQPITLSNRGTGIILISSLTFSNPSGDFSAPNNCPVIPVNASCVIPVNFTPSIVGSETSTLTFNSNAPLSIPINPVLNACNITPTADNVVNLCGTGTAAATFPLSFGCASAETGSGTVTSNESTPLINFHCGPNGVLVGVATGNYTSGAAPVLTAVADAGQTFTTFGGTGCGTTSPSTITVTAATSCTAQFTAPVPQFLETVVCLGQGTGTVISDKNDVLTGTPISVTCTAGQPTGKSSGTFNQGTVVTFTEAPSGSCMGVACTFTSWGGATGCTNATTCAVTTNANATLTANFAAPPSGAPLQLIDTIPGGTAGTNKITGTWGQAISAGDTLIVGGMWIDNTTTVSSINDTSGNTYTQISCSPKTATGSPALTLVYYHADNVAAAAAGANTTTINLTASPATRLLFGLHYTGLTTTPFDVCAGSSNTTGNPNSGTTASTAQTGELLAAFAIVGSHITAVGTNYTQQISANGNDAEDRQGVAIGTYSNNPTQSSSTNWADIVAAFKNSGSSATTFTVAVLCGPNGSGTITGGGISQTCTNGVPSGSTPSVSVALNSTISITATPNSGSSFVNYNGAGCGTIPTCTTVAITTNTNITAFFATSGVQAYFVRPDGSDSNTGLANTAGAAWLTIGHAASALTLGTSGATVNVAAGTYGCVSTSRSGTSTQPLVYISTTPLGAKITCNGFGSSQGLWQNSGAYVTIQGFEVTAPAAPTGNPACAGIWTTGIQGRMLSNYVHDLPALIGPAPNCSFGGGGIIVGVGGSGPTFADDTQVLGNIVASLGVQNGSCPGIHGIYLSASSRAIVENNIVSGACAWGIQTFHQNTTDVISNNTVLANLRGGILVVGSDGTTNNNTSAFNNIVINNANSGGALENGIEERYGAAGPNNVYRNNLLVHNLSSNFNLTFGPETTTGNLCDVSGSGCATVISASQALTSNIFVNYTGNAFTGNYHLKAGSVGINAGSSGPCASAGVSPCVPSSDFSGSIRPIGPAIDIGAYEQ